jgi:hypothetical protein
MTFTRLNQVDGTFCLIQAPSLAIAPIVRAYHLELLSVVRQFEYWYLEAADTVLFTAHEYYYQAIANHLAPSVEVKLLIPQSRHQFFVATEPTPTPEGETMPGMSQLEQLMGFSYPKPGKGVPSLEVVATTGDYCLDIEASLLLFRPDQAHWLRTAFSPTQISAIITYVNQQSNQDGEVSQLQQEADRDYFNRNQAAIAAEMADHGGGFLL